MRFLRQSTASQEIPIGTLVDATDGDTPMTALTITNTDIKILKAGATSLSSKNSGGATHISGGNYYATLDATDSDTLGSGRIFVHVSGAAPWWDDFVVLPSAIFDWLIAGSVANLPANMIQAAGTAWNSGAISAATLAADTITAAKIAADAIGASELAADAIAEIQSGLATSIDVSVVADAVAALPTAVQNADAVLTRDWTEVVGEADRCLLQAARFLRNKWTVLAGILSVKKEDDSTEAWAAVVSSLAGADPVIGVDPT